MVTEFKYLKGINTLRFFAAFFVIISHANISLIKLGIYQSANYAFLNRGEDAVNFFFTLSGFLITYLLLLEINKTNTVSVKKFYLRRIFRIWPLYFLIVFLGFFIFTVLYQKVYGVSYFSFSIVKGLACFLLFVPNYMTVNYQVGLLFPLWSIGVEEQFYLFWAPLVKFCKKYVPFFLICFTVASTVMYYLLDANFIRFSDSIQKFLLTQKFFEMAIGSLFAYILYKKYEWYNRSFFASKPGQLLVLCVILWHYIAGFPFSGNFFFKVISAFLYGLLILNVSVITNKLLNIDQRALNYLGIISYGLYMYHMLIDYFLRTIVSKAGYMLTKDLLIPLYYLLLLLGTIAVAAFSFKYFEKYFLRLKERLHSNKRVIS